MNPGESGADRIRRHVRARYIDPVRRDGGNTVTIRAGDVARDLHLGNRVPTVCSALGSKLLLEQAGPRDASAFVERTIYAIANRPESEAGDALLDLIANHASSYADVARQALAFHHKMQRDMVHDVPTVARLRVLMTEGAARSLEDAGRSTGSNSDAT